MSRVFHSFGASDDGHRYELIDGVLTVTPAPRFRHQHIAADLFVSLHAALPKELVLFFAPFDVVLAENTVLQPDLLVAPRGAFTEADLLSAPLLAPEVLSSSTRGINRLLKKDRLERAGCLHYWVVDPDGPTIVAWDLVDDAYRETARATGDQQFAKTVPFPVAFAPASLLD
ncbi:MAG: Uma2 family endonuclease [Microbacterium sp.]